MVIAQRDMHVIRNGPRWPDVPEIHGPHKTLYNRFARWSRMAVFAGIFSNLVADHEPPDCLMIDSTHLKAHRTAASLQKKGCSPAYRAHERWAERQAARCLRRDGHPIVFLLTEGRMSEHKGAAIIYPKLPTADMLIGDKLIGDKGYDSEASRLASRPEPIVGCPRVIARPCISSARRSRTCSQGSRIGGASQCVTTAAHPPSSAQFCIAATVIFWINQCVLILVTGQGVGLGEVHLLP